MSLKQDIERELKIPVRIRMGGPGSLNIFADGQQVFFLPAIEANATSGGHHYRVAGPIEYAASTDVISAGLRT